MMRIFIVDDEAPARNRLTTLLEDIAADCPHVLVGEADDAQHALDGIAATHADIVLLDVQMPGMTGIELAARLSLMPRPPAVIFVTAYDEYALKAFEVHALDYLLKPVRATRLAEAIGRVAATRTPASRVQPDTADAPTGIAASAAPCRQHFSVQERGRLLVIPVTDVLYLKAELKYVTLRTKAREYLIEASLQSLEDELSATFVRVHRNALVARHAIIGLERGSHGVDTEHDSDKTTDKSTEKGVDTWQIILRDIDDRVPVSRRQTALVKSLVR